MDLSFLNFIAGPILLDRFFKPKKEIGKERILTPEEAQVRAQEILLQEKIRERQKKWREQVAKLKAKAASIKIKETEIVKEKEELLSLKQKWQEKLQTVAQLTREEAKQSYLEALDKELVEEAARRIKENEEKINFESEEQAKQILITALQRIGTEHVPTVTTSEVRLPNEDLKGRIIGKEGRNIKAFETATGVSVEIGEEEEGVLVSSFDPVRREIAKIALERLIADGRIQPSRIEEVVKKVGDEIYQIIHKAGEDLAYQAKVYDLPREIIDLLGRFKYRTSFGQSMWEHTLEVVRLGEALAAELGARVELTRKACLLHDIGKAVTSETEKGHAEVGAEVCRRNGIPEEVVRTFEGHHTDDFPNLEAVIVFLADAISGARPGARREDFDAYLQRIEDLEKIAAAFEGVDKAYALSAGREVRVLVRPQDISDAQMVKLAHDISLKIHQKLPNFPSPIKVNVVRETRASATAKPKSE